MLVLAAEGTPEGLWLRAEAQTGGRGRLDRAWESPPGNLYCSTIVRMRPGEPAPATLALVAAVAVWQAVELVLPGRARIKWPNDIMIGPAKLCGILLERAGDAIIVGIGLNIRAHPDLAERPTTSLWAQGAVEANASNMLEKLSSLFNKLLETWRTYGLDPIRALWLSAAHEPGTPLRINLPDGTAFDSQFYTLDNDGALIVDLPDGTKRAIHAGDVFLL
ncbi:biotin--[acetyl-CoA-carboxylase] ligase [Sphingobium sp.]|uniref:biotin--[acetyl-CoA-carboxylase] ligase n=1 Tax=Sphingobium sp. TaxID=1912891 RepID=UPI0039B9647A